MHSNSHYKHVTCSGWVRVVGICVCPPFLMITSCIYPIPHLYHITRILTSHSCYLASRGGI